MKTPQHPLSPTASRRRVLGLIGCAAGLGLTPAAALARPAPETNLHRWRGRALGAEAAILLAHPDKVAAEAIFSDIAAELHRLEDIFSLYRPGSAIARLNRDGALDAPPPEMTALLDEVLRLNRLSGGAFSASVQPLWRLYAEHFAKAGADPAGPSRAAFGRALSHVDDRRIDVGSGHIRFRRPGMAITLNGIAQGYITDRIAALMQDRGIDNTLIDLGEHRALGGHPAGRDWQVSITDADAPWRMFDRVSLRNAALATSGAYGTPFGGDGAHHHLFDPRTGKSAAHYKSVSVIAPTATRADGLSTALSILAPGEARALVARFPEAKAILRTRDGRLFSAPA